MTILEKYLKYRQYLYERLDGSVKAIDRENAIDMAISTLLDIWEQIDWSKVTSQRSIGIWDEFASKVKAAAMTTNSYETFVEKLCKKMDVRSLKFKIYDY